MLARPEISPLRGYATPVEMTGASRGCGGSAGMTGVSRSGGESVETTVVFCT